MRWLASLMLLTLLSLTGCNTVKGFGTDIHDVAQNTQTFFEGGTGYNTDSRTPSPNSSSRAINRTASAY